MRPRASLEESLEYCLQELMRTGDVEASLQGDPQRAEQLRPLLQAAQAARRYYAPVPEAPGGLVAGRERLLALAAERRERGPATGSPTEAPSETWRRRIQRLLPARPITTMLSLVLGMVILGATIVAAAGDSLPGDLLYPVKLATEDIRLALPSTPGGQVDLALEFVQERGDEMQALIAAGRPLPDQTVRRMERHIERALTQAARASDHELERLLLRIARRTRAQVIHLEQLQEAAPSSAQAGLERAAVANREGAEAAEAGLKDPETFRWRYRHRQGEPAPTAEPEQNQERRQHQNRELEGQGEGTPTVTLSATRGVETTPAGARGTATPQTPRQGPEATSAPSHATDTFTPTATPRGMGQTPQATATPRGSSGTSGPSTTPQGPRATETPHGPGPIAEPSATPQGPDETGGPQATPGNPSGTSQSPKPGGGHGSGN